MGNNGVMPGDSDFKDYALAFVFFPIIAGLLTAFGPYIGYKEKASVRECVRKTVEPEGISVTTNEMKPVTRFVISGISVLIGVLVFLFGVLEIDLGGWESDSAVVFDDEYNNNDRSNNNKNTSLTQTYVNADEGFSFMYPYGWEIEDVEEFADIGDIGEVGAEVLVWVVCTGATGTFAPNMSVVKVADDVTKEDWEEGLSSDASKSNVKVIDLSDIELDGCPAKKLTVAFNNNSGIRFTTIQYFYIRDIDIYIVECIVEEDKYDRYEPIFNAIMDSYTITAADGLNASNENAMNAELCYDVISASEMMGLSAAEIVHGSFGGSCTADGNGHIIYDDIVFEMADDETVNSIRIWNVGRCSINGKPLKINSDGVVESEAIIALFGQDYKDEWLDIGYFMSYQYQEYALLFEVNKFNEVCSILMLRNSSGAGADPDYGLSDFSYHNLFLYGGSYEGINQTSIYVNIYSSFDEGNTVGNVYLYDSFGHETFALIRDDNEGEGIYTLCLDGSKDMHIGFYQNFYGPYGECYADIQGLDAIYSNVDEIETYVMTEQYIP